VTRLARRFALLIVLAAGLAGPAQAGTHRVVINGLFSYKPHELPISGDGDFIVRELGWHSWGGGTAVASGQAVEQVRPSHAGTWRLITPPPSPTGPSPSPRPATARKCSTRGMPIAVRSITARGGAICSGARTLVRDWFHRLKMPGGNHCVVPDGGTNPAVCMVGSWRCTSDHTVNGQTYPVTCALRRRRVHFINLV
jgi:hypothetical protein